MKIIFFGTSEFGAIMLEKMVKAEMTPVLVATTPDMPAGRKQELTPSPVKLIAQSFQIPVLQPTSYTNSAIAKLVCQQADLFIVAAYGKILPKRVLNIPKYGALNVHPSLLPKYRGPSPVQAAILNGDEETGVSIMLMDEKIDHGAIVANTKYQILDTKYSYTELHTKLAELGAELLIKTTPDWVTGNIKPVPQDDSRASYTKILKKDDGRIDWKDSAEYIERQVRALNPWPGTFTYWRGKIMKILTAHIEEGKLVLDDIQLQGGKPMSFREFLLGHKDFNHAQLF